MNAGMRVANLISFSWICFRFDLYFFSSSDSSFFGFGPADRAERIVVDFDEHRQQSTITQDELEAGSGSDSSNIRAYENGRAPH